MLRRLLLLFFVILWVSGGCRRTETTEAPSPRPAPLKTRSVTLYFESPSLLLAPEKRELSLPEETGPALQPVIEQLLEGSSNAAIPALFPPDTVVRGAYLLADGTAVIDLGGGTLAEGWNTGSHTEMMAVYSVVQTLVENFEEVGRVRILVNGQPAQTLAGHIAIDRPLRPMKSLLAAPRQS